MRNEHQVIKEDSAFNVISAETLFNTASFTERGNLFHSRRWLKVLEKEYQFEFRALADSRREEYLLFNVQNDFSGKRITCLPFSDYVAPEIPTGEIYSLLDHLSKVYPDHSVIYKAGFEPSPVYLDNDWTVTREAFYHRVEIAGEDEMWANLSPSFRRGIKKAQQNNVRVSIHEDRQATDRFFELFSWLRKKKFHSIPQPLSFFHAVYEEFIAQRSGFVMEARGVVDGGEQLLASIIVLVHGNVLYYKFGASDISALESRPNNLLFWHLLLVAAEKGYSQVDLGLSGKAKSYEGLVRFKEGLGGTPLPITYFRKDPAGYDNQKEKEFKKLLSDLTNIFVDETIDIEIAQKAGQILYKYFA